MKNINSIYWVLPLLAVNIYTAPNLTYAGPSRDPAAFTDGSRDSSSTSCNLDRQLARGGNNVSATCALTSNTKIVNSDKEQVYVTGNLTVTRRTITVAAEQAAEYDFAGRKKETAPKEGPQQKVIFEATLTFDGEGVDSEPITREFPAERLSSAKEIYNEMVSEYKKGLTRIQRDIKDLAAKEKRQQLLAEGHEKCLNASPDEGGKAYEVSEQIDCHVKRLGSKTGSDAVSYYNANLKQSLESLVFRGDAAEREQAAGILDSIQKTAGNSSVKKSASVLKKSVVYQNQIEALAMRVQAAGDNRQELAAAQTALQGLQMQMKNDLGRDAAMSQFAMMRSGNNLSSMQSMSDSNRYMSLINNNLKLAFMSPDRLFQLQGSGSNTGIPSYNTDPMNRMPVDRNMMMARPGQPQQPLPPGVQPMPQQMQAQRPMGAGGPPPYMMPGGYTSQSYSAQRPVLRPGMTNFGIN